MDLPAPPVSSPTTTAPGAPKAPPPKLVDVTIVDENTALNVIVSFVTLAQKRGAFTIEESSKIWECIKKFQKA